MEKQFIKRLLREVRKMILKVDKVIIKKEKKFLSYLYTFLQFLIYFVFSYLCYGFGYFLIGGILKDLELINISWTGLIILSFFIYFFLVIVVFAWSDESIKKFLKDSYNDCKVVKEYEYKDVVIKINNVSLNKIIQKSTNKKRGDKK